MNGKNKCKMLKEIRRRIAEENNIAYVTSECKHRGNCLGTCPKCEAEVRYLEEQLAARKRAGYAVALTGLALTLTTATASCVPETILQSLNPTSAAETSATKGSKPKDTTISSESTEYIELGGDPMPPPDIMGEEVPPPSEMGEAVPLPEFEILLHYTGAQRNDYIKNYDRETIRTAWEDYRGAESEFRDYFGIDFGDKQYTVEVTYESNGRAKSIKIIEFEPEDELMGDA